MKVAKSPDDLLPAKEMLSMTGLEVMQGVVAGKYPGPPMGHTLGYGLVKIDAGRAVFHGTPEFSVTNPSGPVHGGWYGAILDSAMACAVMTKVPRGSSYTTLEYKINIIRPIPLGMKVECTGTVDHVGRSTGIARGEIRGVENGKLYATGSTTCIVMDMSGR